MYFFLEKKTHIPRKSNKAFCDKIAPVVEAVEILHACGFEDAGDELEIRASVADGWLCGQTVKYLDLVLNSL